MSVEDLTALIKAHTGTVVTPGYLAEILWRDGWRRTEMSDEDAYTLAANLDEHDHDWVVDYEVDYEGTSSGRFRFFDRCFECGETSDHEHEWMPLDSAGLRHWRRCINCGVEKKVTW